ncbi:hypothetical protein P2H44_20125 [Albimonas sp. CAU 1670]|uniref:hypothetical protein n=1 Tax=Albimonas sp. CAU 1670 TaxID=3032599 RepID=UPI0023DC4DE9|nr:hypothetical protein [Albimonas sp. CAU 1670]MDF2234873.1 hypothetical protein [Albimonas sp. CAU 1670]
MRPGFIFMLTRNDLTVPDAPHHLETALAAGVRQVGFKDVGLPVEDLRALAARIRAAGGTCWLEVVSLDAASEAASVRAGVEIGVDRLLGGCRPEVAAPLLAGTGIGYYPFPGRITGHPSVLEGDVEEIAASARALAARPEVAGLDLLAYRGSVPAEALAARVCAAAGKPVIAAGSIDRPARVEAMARAGCAGFTVGTAALDGAFQGAPADLPSQLRAILSAAACFA